MVACDGIEVCLDWRFLFCPQRVVPAASHNPFTRCGSFYARRDALLHVVKRLAAYKINIQLFKAARAEMHVSIIEAGHHKVAAKIDDLGFWALELLNFIVCAGSADFSTVTAMAWTRP